MVFDFLEKKFLCGQMRTDKIFKLYSNYNHERERSSNNVKFFDKIITDIPPYAPTRVESKPELGLELFKLRLKHYYAPTRIEMKVRVRKLTQG